MGTSGSTRNHYTPSVKSVMPQIGARSHRRLGWLLIAHSATSESCAVLVKDVHATPKQYNCSITAPSAETSYIGLMVYDIGGSTLHIVYLPSATDPRQGFSKLQPCYQGCHAAQQRQNYCFLPHIIATCSVAECSHMQ